jgi:hypothetical protein
MAAQRVAPRWARSSPTRPRPPGGYPYADPYQDNYGAFAMLLAGRAYYGDVLSYIKWYLRHVSYSTQADTYQGMVGTIFDYTVNLRACSETSTGSYDSSDAYAGTFLSLVSAFVRADPSQAAYFASPGPRRDLAAIAAAIQATQGKNGLTSALASLMPAGQYTEDNIESSQGLADYVGLLASEGDADASYWAGIASSIRNGIASHEWLPGAGAYRNAADQSTAGFTPCGAGQVQLWPAWDPQGTSRWRRSVISSYAAADGGWAETTPGYPDTTCDDEHDPESFTAYAAAQTGRTAAAAAWLDNSQVNWVDAGRPYPWTVQDSGVRALTAYVLSRRAPYVI